MNFPFVRSSYRYWAPVLAGSTLAIVLAACEDMVVRDYEAIATATVTWRVPYEVPGDRLERYEEFASASVVNLNGEKPEESLPEADDKGVWWPKLPPRPGVDEIEERAESGETPGRPEALREVKYALKFEKDTKIVELPTNYATYRQAVRARRDGKALDLTLGPREGSVTKAEPVE